MANAPKREARYDRDASQERAGIYRLSTALAVSGDLSAAQREELCRVARPCPVHGLMTEVTTEIATVFLPDETLVSHRA